MNRPKPTVVRDGKLNAVRIFFQDFAHELADAARLLGGAPAEAQVISCGIHLETATHIDSRIYHDLVDLCRLLGLHDVGDPDRIETEYFSGIDPASRQVETICLLTDMLEDLLDRIDHPSPDCLAAEAEDEPYDPALAA